MAKLTKPFVLICATPATSHMLAATAIAKELTVREYEVTYLSPSVRREITESTGAAFAPLLEDADFFLAGSGDELIQGRELIPEGPERMLFDLRKIFIEPITAQYQSIQKVLQDFKSKDASRPVVILNESMFWGAMPLKLGAPGLYPAGLISFGGMPLPLSSIDTAPFGPGLLPDSTEEGRRRNIAMTKEAHEVMFARPQKDLQDVLRSVGASKAPYVMFDNLCHLSDRFIQLCHPELEYPRSDAPSSIIYAGVIPHRKEPWTGRPSWWDEVAENAEQKRIVFVSQGTVALDYEDLIIPTLQGLKDLQDTLVIVALGHKGFSLSPGTDIPANARVADFIPYYEALAHADVFIGNGGYGGFQQSVGNGVPIIIAGASEDKPEVAARAEYSGVGINLRTPRPTSEQVRAAVEKMFRDQRYKTRAKELEAKMRDIDPFSIIAKTIDEVAAASA